MQIFDYVFLTVLLACFIGVLLYLFRQLNTKLNAFSHDKLVDLSMDVLTELIEDKEMQKEFYVLGGIVGAGVGKNLGLSGGGGSHKFDIVKDGVPMILGQLFGGGFQTQPATSAVPEQPANNGSNKDAIIKRLTT